MKTFNSSFFAVVFSILLSLAVSCNSTNSSITTSDAENLKRSRGYKSPQFIQDNAFGIFAGDSLNISSAAAAATQPDLVVQLISSVSPLPEITESGSGFTVTTKIKNKGKKKAIDKFTTLYYLSSDNSYSSEDLLLTGGRTVSGLKSKKTVIGRTNLTVPPSTPSGTYYLIACVDRPNTIAESNETNNCMSSKTPFDITNISTKEVIPVSEDVLVKEPGITNSYAINLPDGHFKYDDISLDLQDILTNYVTITPGLAGNSIIKKFLAMFTSPAEATSTMYMYVRIGASVDTVCQDGFLYDTITFNGNGYIDPSTVSAAPSSVSIINSGSAAMCIQILSEESATINISNVSIDATPCNQAPANISGTWKGKYTCINYGCADCNEVNLPVKFTITYPDPLDKTRAVYTDGTATYNGTVCGNVFKFDGGDPGLYKENGTFVLNNNGTGTKNSTWYSEYNPDTFWGTCTDNIHR